MKMFNLFFITTLFFSTLLSNILIAQQQGKVYEQFQDAIVNQYGKTLTSPWCGGVNSIQINHADLNNDGKKDIILYDHNTNSIKTFLNTGVANETKYTYNPIYEKNFPEELESFMLLRDYNCDGIADLFFNGAFGMPCYKGYYQNNQLKFSFYKNIWAKRPNSNDSINVYVQNNDIPSIEDFDGDGDLDILAFDIQGIYTVMHKNMRVEYGMPCDSMKMIIGDKCWGKFFQGFNREVIFNSFCSQLIVNNGQPSVNKKYRHTGNCILGIDIDGDNDMDLMGGNISFADAQLVLNNGNDVMFDQDTTYNSNGKKLLMSSWPAPFHADIDNDGDKDLLFTSHADDDYSANYNVIEWYQNIGNTSSPNYVFYHDSVLITDMIDLGSYSYPTFFDYDKDGKKDLFIGSQGTITNNTALSSSKISYYRNTSTLSSISFQLVTKDFLSISLLNKNGIFPTFGDITGDGVDDLILGSENGNISLFTNVASSNSVIPIFTVTTDSMAITNIGEFSTPLVYDFNKDGKNDLLVGSQSGFLAYFEDTSSTSVTQLALKTTTLGNVKAGDPSNFFGFSAPFIGKIDNTDSTFLLLGNIDGTIQRFDSLDGNFGSFRKRDSMYSLIKTASRSVPVVEDLNGDGKYEMVVGNKMGGLTYYKQVLTIFPEDVNNIVLNQNAVEIYPNPTSNNIYLLFKDNFLNREATISVFDVFGRKINSSTINTQASNSVELKTVSTGVYFLKIEIGQQSITKKIIKH